MKFSFSLRQLQQQDGKSFFVTHPLFLISLVGMAAGMALAWYVSSTRIAGLSELAALHYNIYFGIDYFGPRNLLLLYPIIASVIGLVNFTIAVVVYRLSRLLSYLLLLVGLWLVAMVNIALYFVTLITS